MIHPPRPFPGAPVVLAARVLLVGAALPLLALVAPATGGLTAPAATDSSAVAELQREAVALTPLVTSKLAREFIEATVQLPHITPRTVLHDSARTSFWWENEAAALPDTTRARLGTRTLDEQFYYNTRYGSPLAYVRPLELLARAGLADAAGLGSPTTATARSGICGCSQRSVSMRSGSKSIRCSASSTACPEIRAKYVAPASARGA